MWDLDLGRWVRRLGFGISRTRPSSTAEHLWQQGIPVRALRVETFETVDSTLVFPSPNQAPVERSVVFIKPALPQ